MNDATHSEKIHEHLKDKVLELTNPAPRRIFLKVSKENLVQTVRFLKDSLSFTHLSTISGVDKRDVFEVLYHLANEYLSLSVRITTPRNEPVIPSICEVIPGAILYERELQDMFGLTVENIPDARPLILPDDWPAQNFPLRKDWKFERPPEKIPGGT